MTDSDDSQQTALSVGQLIAERYRIEALLGEGGMGAVYRAEHIHMKKTVALKVLHRHMTSHTEAVRRFEREAVVAARVEHPNVALATDFGQLPDGAFYMVLEYVDGVALSDLIAREGALSPERAVRIAWQIAEALQAAHGAEVVHRDLKPDNVMLVQRGEQADIVKVLDFGIAKLRGERTQLTQLGSVFGTPQYMAPEQAAGREVDQRADLYALGLILHEMLTGYPAFDGDDLMSILAQQMTQPPPPLPSSVPEPLARIVAALLVKDPAQRLGSAAELLANLQVLTEEALPAARPPMASVVGGRATAMPTLFTGGKLASATGSPWARWRASLRGPLAQITTLGRQGATALRAMPPRRAALVVGLPIAALVLGVGATLLFWPHSAQQGGQAAAATDAEDDAPDPQMKEILGADGAVDPELERVIQAARIGSQPALYALAQKDESKRTAREWLAMAQGYLKRRELTKSLASYGKAVDADASYAGDRTMLSGLRYFADKPESSLQILDFAAQHLGSHGADLLFNVWAATSRKTESTTRARALLDDPKVKTSSSEALSLALRLRVSEGCAQLKALLPDLERVGDDRSLFPLREAAKTTGCGADGKDDCYACLRSDDALDKTITQVQMRHGPRYETRRWR